MPFCRAPPFIYSVISPWGLIALAWGISRQLLESWPQTVSSWSRPQTWCLGLCLELCALGLHPRLSSNKSASFFIAITVLVIPVLVFIINQLSFVILLLTNENEPALPDVGSLGLVLKLSLEYCLSLMKLSLVYVYRVYNHCKVRCFLKHFTKLPLLVYPLIPPVTFHRE